MDFSDYEISSSQNEFQTNHGIFDEYLYKLADMTRRPKKATSHVGKKKNYVTGPKNLFLSLYCQNALLITPYKTKFIHN